MFIVKSELRCRLRSEYREGRKKEARARAFLYSCRNSIHWIAIYHTPFISGLVADDLQSMSSWSNFRRCADVANDDREANSGTVSFNVWKSCSILRSCVALTTTA